MREAGVPSTERPDRVSVLLVDDQRSRLLSYDAILEDLGQRLVHASSGVEALDRLMKGEFAVILLDVSMPRMDGFETAAVIRSHPRFEKTPIIFVTAHHVTDLDQLKGYELGAVDYVYVPVVPQILRSKVAVFVELEQKRRELQRVNRSLVAANAELARANAALRDEKSRELASLNRTLETANSTLALTNASLHEEVAERRRAEGLLRGSEERLRAMDRRKDEFLATLAHELRNPLAPIVNAAQLIARHVDANQEARWCVQVIQHQAQQLGRLVEDLLDVSRITQGKIQLRWGRVDVVESVQRAVDSTHALAAARGQTLEVSLPDEEIVIEGDAVRLVQAVGNLLHNAVKYSEDGGRIRVTVACEASVGDVRIRVRDEGIGLSPELLDRIFDLFAQADQSLDRSQGGLGIGLALVRKLVELHGGSVVARSDGVGKGSEFEVRLRRGAPAGPEPEQDPGPVAAAPLPRRILVADDNADSALTLAALLRAVGYHVEVAADGAEAVETAARMKPDAVFLDVGMPRMDGCEAARRIRSEPWGRNVALVAITGWDQSEVRDRTRDSGFDVHMVKPVDVHALREVLDRLDAVAERAG